MYNIYSYSKYSSSSFSSSSSASSSSAFASAYGDVYTATFTATGDDDIFAHAENEKHDTEGGEKSFYLISLQISFFRFTFTHTHTHLSNLIIYKLKRFFYSTRFLFLRPNVLLFSEISCWIRIILFTCYIDGNLHQYTFHQECISNWCSSNVVKEPNDACGVSTRR